ncbi:hypothetical protein HOO65_010252 [Ceratocystis lukuohia]|uniref:Uncharacterized protein n=1 Tax=Ceratocystis lukuohia TaxID=2019550 RepID=A0ABR4MRI9_9PEZI
MRILSVLPLSFLLPIGANAGVLGYPGYPFDQPNNQLCVAISDHASGPGELLNRFEVDQAEKTVTVYTISNSPESQNAYRPPTADDMVDACQKCGLELDSVNSVVFHNPMEPCIQLALKSYRDPRWDEVRENEHINSIIIPDMVDDWHLFSQCTPFVSIQGMLANSFIEYISVVESENGCSLSYSIKPKEQDYEDMEYSEYES